MTGPGDAKAAGLSVRLRYVVYATRDRVFDALTRADLIGQWSTGRGMVSPEVDGPFEWFDGWVKGQVLAFESPSKLASTWKPAEWGKKTPASTVTMVFHDHAAGTEIALEHTGFPDEEEARKHESGWIDHVFEPLNEYFTR